MEATRERIGLCSVDSRAREPCSPQGLEGHQGPSASLLGPCRVLYTRRRSCQSVRFRHADRQKPTQLNFLQGDENVHFIGGFVSSCGWWLRHRPGSEDVTGAVTWVSVQSTLVFWFNKNCASRGPWGRRHRGTRDPARSRARPGERRSVHKSAKMASRSRFGALVYTVATRGPRARPWGRRSVHRLAKMASRGCFGALVYTVALL